MRGMMYPENYLNDTPKAMENHWRISAGELHGPFYKVEYHFHCHEKKKGIFVWKIGDKMG